MMDTDERLPTLLGLQMSRLSPEQERWLIVEEEIGLNLPITFKNMNDQLGQSSWGDFLHVLCPFSENPHLNLMRKGKVILEADRINRESFPAHYPLPLFPEAGGLLPWSTTDNGDTLYWITSGDPNEWPTVIKGPRAPDFEVNFMPSHLLIYHFASSTLRSSLLSSLG